MYVILFGPLEFKLNCTIRIRIAEVFRIPLSPFSSHRSHNCKREGNYNLLSMILQIDIPFPSLMNALLLYDFFSYFPNIYKIFCYFVSFFPLHCLRPLIKTTLFKRLLIQFDNASLLCAVCSSLGIYQPKSLHCPGVNPGSAPHCPALPGNEEHRCEGTQASDWSPASLRRF